MSLLITSNSPESINSGYEQEGINQSYSYSNHLNDTFKIPANSEVAVQSVKINRSGNIAVNDSNSIFSFYFGEEIDNVEVVNACGVIFTREEQQDVLSVPWSTSFGGDIGILRDLNSNNFNPNLVNNQTLESFTGNVDNIARRIKRALNRSLWHPMLLQNASTGRNPGANVVPLRNGSGLDWLGWKIEITNTDETKNASNISASWMGERYNGTEDGDPYTYNPSTRILTPPAGSVNSCVGIDFPLSLANGSFSASLNKRHSVGPQRIGLCRALEDAPPYYFDDPDGDNFYDYLVEIADDGEIFLLHSIPNYDNSELTLETVEYAAANLNASTLGIDVIKFNIKNERVKVSIVDDKGVEIVLVDGTSSKNGSNLKPVCMTNRFLFPKIDLSPGNFVKIEEYFGVNITNFKYEGLDDGGNYTFHDWWKTNLINGTLEQSEEIDLRFVKNDPNNPGGHLFQAGLNANKQCDYKVQFFFAPDNRYWNTAYCNSQYLMGFPNRSLVNVANSVAGTSPFTLTFQSDSSPEMKSTQSLFVRLKNFTHSSVNLAKGSNSKILYHVPAFSNTGTRVGALYFEPNEKTYLKLNNPQDLYLSNIDVDIVYSDETLATDLQGKTTVIFHIRDAKM
jgi:hypothetical protein